MLRDFSWYPFDPKSNTPKASLTPTQKPQPQRQELKAQFTKIEKEEFFTITESEATTVARAG